VYFYHSGKIRARQEYSKEALSNSNSLQVPLYHGAASEAREKTHHEGSGTERNTGAKSTAPILGYGGITGMLANPVRVECRDGRD